MPVEGTPTRVNTSIQCLINCGEHSFLELRVHQITVDSIVSATHNSHLLFLVETMLYPRSSMFTGEYKVVTRLDYPVRTVSKSLLVLVDSLYIYRSRW